MTTATAATTATDAAGTSPADEEEAQDDAAPAAENKGLSTMLPPAPPQASVLGICEWKNLQLAPPPPMYRPFAILNEERGEKKSRIQKMREKIVPEDHESSDSDSTRRESHQIGGSTKLPKEPEQINLLEEKVARTGEYVLIVNDVTNPPFMGIRLPPSYLLLKLKRPKKIIVKKPKWDTQRHIAMNMARGEQ